MKQVTILITAAGSPTWPHMAKALKNNGEREIRIVGVDIKTDPTMLNYLDVMYEVPPFYSAKYIERLIDICKKEKIDIIIPGMSQELGSLQDNLELFELIGVKLAISKNEKLEIANNKAKLFDYLLDKKIELPKYKLANTPSEVIEACYALDYPQKPVCVKICDGAGSRGVRIIDPSVSRFDLFINSKPDNTLTTMEEFSSMLSEVTSVPTMMIMEYLPGPEYCVDVLADNGNVIYMAGQKVKTLAASTPMESTLVKDDLVYKHAEKIVGLLELDGNIGLDYRYNLEGEAMLTEINPRITQALSLVEASGADLLYFRIKQLLGECIPIKEVIYGTTIKRRYAEEFFVNNKM